MRILGHSKLDTRTERVDVGEVEGKPVIVTMRAPSLGEIDRINAEMPDPRPPGTGKVLRGERGHPLKDGRGRIRQEEDPLDPTYLAKLKETQRARSCAVVVLCLGNQIDLGADLARDQFPNEIAFYTAVLEEMGKAGIDWIAFARLNAAAVRLMSVDAEEVTAARAELTEKDDSGN